jgi:hypothetical protein
MENLVEAFDAHGNDRDSEPRAHHADAGHERRDLALRVPGAFRKNQHGIVVREHLADVAQCLPRARFLLRDGEGVEELAREVVPERVPEHFLARELARERNAA